MYVWMHISMYLCALYWTAKQKKCSSCVTVKGVLNSFSSGINFDNYNKVNFLDTLWPQCVCCCNVFCLWATDILSSLLVVRSNRCGQSTNNSCIEYTIPTQNCVVLHGLTDMKLGTREKRLISQFMEVEWLQLNALFPSSSIQNCFIFFHWSQLYFN